MTQLLAAVSGLIVQIIFMLGYAGVGLLMGLQTIAIPIPSEVILPFAGYLVFLGRFNFWLVALVGAVCSSMGASIAYFIGFKGGRPLVEKYGKIILISRHDLEIADRFFEKHGSKAAFFGMMLPIFRSFISFPAGISKVPLKKFLVYVFLGSFVWSLLLTYLGLKLGENWASLRERFKGLDYLVIVAIIFLAIWWVYRHFKNKDRESRVG